MRDASDVKKRLLERLQLTLVHPKGFGRDVEIFVTLLLQDLLFIDEREMEFKVAIGQLEQRGLITSVGVKGAFEERFRSRSIKSFENEVASIYAEVADRFGYVDIERYLSSDEWQHVRRDSRELVRSRDWRRSEALEEFGAPSLTIGSTTQPVDCYVSRNSSQGWVFFDYWNIYIDGYIYGKDPVLRNVRLPTRVFARSIVKTPWLKPWI